MVAPVDLVNQALDQIGVTVQVNGINPPNPAGSLAAQVASRTYQTQVDSIFRAVNWNCARLTSTLTLLKARRGTPENPDGAFPEAPLPYLYEYAYPNDCLKMRFLMPNPFETEGDETAPTMTNVGTVSPDYLRTGIPFIPAIDTDLSGNQINVLLTNAREAIGVYTGRIANPDLWDPMLRDTVIAALAAWFVNPLARNQALLKERVQAAASMLLQARVADANEGISSSDNLPDWMKARGVGADYGYGFGYGTPGQGSRGFDNWCAPDGIWY